MVSDTRLRRQCLVPEVSSVQQDQGAASACDSGADFCCNLHLAMLAFALVFRVTIERSHSWFRGQRNEG